MENRFPAACRGLSPELFFPDPSEIYEIDAALMACSGCVGRVQCLDGAVQRNEPVGIWGGIDFGLPREGSSWSPAGLVEARAATVRAAAGEPPKPAEWQDERPCPRCTSLVPEGEWPVDRNGPDATCGIPSTYNRGCRCLRCGVGKSEYHRRSQ